MNTEERTITIVDDIMGSGKSTWAINYINDNPDRKFLCIVPLLSECERFKDGTDIDIVDPEKWGSKWKHFRWLVENEKNIVTTHSLIQKMDLDMLELLKSKDYVLMIDECLDVLDTYKINTEKSNMKNDDCKIGGHVVPDNMAKNFGAVEVDGAADVPDHTWDEEAEMKKDTDRFHVLA